MPPFRRLSEAFSYIESFTNFEKLPPQHVRDLKLHRMVDLLQRCGNPHNKLKTVHIAGSKGKGSTAAFLAGILKAAGYSTGMYTSPHVRSYTERISKAGEPFPDTLYLAQADRVKATVENLAQEQLAGDWEPTTFELLTLLAFLVFEAAGCTWGVIETGIGGRLDATNVIQPEAVVLTPIELEHTDILGDTIGHIAAEKAGIIKEGVPVFCSPQKHKEAYTIFDETAVRLGAPFYPLEEEVRSMSIESDRQGTDISATWKDGSTLKARLGLLGDFQGENALLAAACARRLLRPHLPEEKVDRAVQVGLSQTRIRGRMELIPGEPPIVLDGAHTAVSVQRSGQNFARVFAGRRVLIFGSVSGKDWEGMAAALAPLFDLVIVSTPGSFKKSDPEALCALFRQYHDHVELIPDPEEALKSAREAAGASGAVLITGSFYMIGEYTDLTGPEE